MANNLLGEDKLCDGAWHLELSMRAFGSALTLFEQDWPNVSDNRVKRDRDSLVNHHSQTVDSCITNFEGQMSLWIRSGDYSDAIAECTTLVQRFPHVVTKDIFRHLGSAYYGADRFSEAEKVARQILKHNPKDPWAHLGVGMALDTLSRLDSVTMKPAIGHFREAVRYLPLEGGDQQIRNLVYFHLSRVLIDSEDIEEAREGCKYIFKKVHPTDARFIERVEKLCDRCTKQGLEPSPE